MELITLTKAAVPKFSYPSIFFKDILKYLYVFVHFKYQVVKTLIIKRVHKNETGSGQSSFNLCETITEPLFLSSKLQSVFTNTTTV